MNTPERSVEEIAKKFNNDMAFQLTPLTPSNDTIKAVRLAHKMVIELLKAERKKRDEAVEAERERIWTEVSMKTPALSANWPKKATYNTGKVDGWNICKSFIREIITNPNNPK
jgi:hypothetical protein